MPDEQQGTKEDRVPGRRTQASAALRPDADRACRHLRFARPAPSAPGSRPAALCPLDGPGHRGAPRGTRGMFGRFPPLRAPLLSR